MEAHTFQVDSSFEVDSRNNSSSSSGGSSKIPVWKVCVFRQGVSDPIGVLFIDSTNFPPRVRKNKIVWKLPDTASSTPKFNEHERKRLWELWKQQKRERRKKGKDNDSSVDLSTVAGSLSFTLKECEEEQVENEIQECTTNDTGDDGVLMNNSESSDLHTLPKQSTPRPPPPPGFTEEALDTNTAAATMLSSPLVSSPPTSRTLMDSLSLDDVVQDTKSTATLSSPQSTLHSADSALLSQQLPTHSHSPFPLSSPLTPSAAQLSSRCFRVHECPDSAFRFSLGTTVISMFQQFVSSGQASEWLSYYSTTASSSLLLNTAQVASFQTWQEKWQEWTSLSDPRCTSWDCHGWTAQTIRLHHNNNGSINNGEAINSNTVSEHDGFLMVMTGRTIQRKECLAFNLTLVLRPCIAIEENSNHVNDKTWAYQIENDILSLTLLDVPTLVFNEEITQQPANV